MAHAQWSFLKRSTSCLNAVASLLGKISFKVYFLLILHLLILLYYSTAPHAQERAAAIAAGAGPSRPFQIDSDSIPLPAVAAVAAVAEARAS